MTDAATAAFRPDPKRGLNQAVTLAAVLAATLPSLLAFNVAPSPTFLNQALAFTLWGAFVVVSAPAAPRMGPLPVYAALALLGLEALVSWLPGAWPSTFALSALATLAAAGLLMAAGAGARQRSDATSVFAAFCWAWVVAGVFNIGVAGIQVFAPEWTDGDWIATSGYIGRAVGNLRQPNHLSSLLLWSCIAVVALLELGRLGRRAAAGLLAGLVFAVVLTASRTGLLSVLLLALWGVADRRLSRSARLLLVAAPLVYLLSWLGMAQWAALSQHSFGGEQRLAESDISSSRFAIWRDTLVLIAQQPWLGVGLGEFNLAWTLTPLPHRPVAFFDHTHDLPLQLAVELGVPMALLISGLLTWGLWRGAARALQTGGELGTAQRCAMMMVLMIGLHSLLEYPLWYSYFLLPAAWAWGFALPEQEGTTQPAGATAEAAQPGLTLGGLALMAGTALSVLDYARVTQIFTAAAGAPPLEQRIATGQRSVFFAHHADYAAATSGVPSDPEKVFARPTHYLLDARLLMAWAQSLAERGRLDEARHIAQRLREFRKSETAEFFAGCPREARPVGAATAAQPSVADSFACELPQRVPDWREFLNHP
jgi:O-antigen ligase